MSAERRYLHIILEVTRRCNVRCQMCTVLLDPDPKGQVEMPLALFHKVAEQAFPVAKSVSFCGAGETLLVRALPEMLKRARAQGVPDVSVTTNGTTLNEAMARTLCDAGVSRVRLSLDGATAATFERIRRGASFEKVLRNVRGLVRHRDGRGLKEPRLGVNMVLMRSNIAELPAMIDLAHSLGAEAVSCTHVVPFEGLNMEHETLLAHPEDTNRALEAARKRARRLGVIFDGPKPFAAATDAPAAPSDKLGRPLAAAAPEPPRRASRDPLPPRCLSPFRNFTVATNGNVLPCCNWSEEQPVGNMRTQSFDEVWRGAGYETLRGELFEGRLRNSCLTCPQRAGIGDVNDPSTFRTRQTVRRGN